MPQNPVKDFKLALREVESLHGNMAVLSRLSPMLKDPNSDLSDLSRLIQSDSGLSVSIVKLSNSMVYGVGREIGDVPSAVGKVGFKEVLRLVGAALSKQVFMRDLEVYGITADAYWSQSYFAGLFLEEIASRIGVDRDDAYMVGLLHCIGKVVLNEMVSGDEVSVYWDPTFPPEKWEELMFGVHFDEAGALLLESWKFPETIYGRVRDQLDPDKSRSDMILGALSFITEVLTMNHFDFDAEQWVYPDDHFFCEASSSEPQVLEAGVNRSRVKMDEVRKTLQGGV